MGLQRYESNPYGRAHHAMMAGYHGKWIRADEVDAQIAALLKYVEHTAECLTQYSARNECTCGLDELLKEAGITDGRVDADVELLTAENAKLRKIINRVLGADTHGYYVAAMSGAMRSELMEAVNDG